ncbi:MAG TPA: YlbF family regulator [Phycisphaerae bacterium]|nr:YlbF family regulator [Phycisphaerae bacterium]
MEDIIADAKALGKKIAAHPRTAKFLVAAKAVSEDKAAQDVLKAYQDQVNRIREAEASGKPIEPEDKRKLMDCEAQLAGNDKLKEMMKHQADYLEMMHRINSAIDEATQAEGA